MLRAFGTSDTGRVRPINEDYLAIDEALGLLVVADGMGGHNAGEVAARLAVDAVVRSVRDSAGLPGPSLPFGLDPLLSLAANRLRTAVQLANMDVLESAGQCADYQGMGTTLVAALVEGNRAAVAHVGDSRLYVISAREPDADARERPHRQDRVARLLTTDDSWAVEALARNPDADPEVLRHHPMRHALTNVIGARPWTDIHVIERVLADGDVLLLTTDGVHGMVDERRLARILDEYEGADAAAALVRAALARGSRDNCTAVVGYFSES
jgi:protein phosphatase